MQPTNNNENLEFKIMTPTEQEVTDTQKKLRLIAKEVDKQLPYGWGFVVLTFPFGADARMLYVANAQRPDVVRAMYEFIARTKEQYGVDVADEGAAAEDDQLARALQRVAELEGQLAEADKLMREADAVIAKLRRNG